MLTYNREFIAITHENPISIYSKLDIIIKVYDITRARIRIYTRIARI